MVKCPVCNKEIEEWRGVCPYCKNKTDVSERLKDKTNAYYLNIIAYVNIILMILGAIILIAYPFINDYDEGKVVYITLGIVLGIIGITIYFTLKTIIDIYYKVKK